MAFDAFLKIAGVDSESTDDKHQKWIEVLSFSWGADQPLAGSRSSVGSLTGERANIHDISIVKQLDLASPTLFLGCCNGKHYTDATLELCRAGEDKQKYFELKMTDVIISSYRPGGSSHSDGTVPHEEISLNFGKIEMKYSKTDPRTGKVQGSSAAGWNLEKNTKV